MKKTITFRIWIAVSDQEQSLIKKGDYHIFIFDDDFRNYGTLDSKLIRTYPSFKFPCRSEREAISRVKEFCKLNNYRFIKKMGRKDLVNENEKDAICWQYRQELIYLKPN